MGETETTKPAEDTQEKAGEEETTTSENNNGADDDTEEGADADENNDGGSDDEEETDDDEDDADDKKSKKSTSKDDKKGEEDDEKEPPTRKRPIDFIKERQERRKAKSGDQGKGKASENDDDDEDDDIDPADKETIGKVVEKALKPFIEKEVKQQDEQEIKDFLTANPDFKPYEAKARKYMSHPSRKDVPISEIFYGVAGADLLKIGAKRAKIADDEAKKTKSAGGATDAGGVKSNADLSKEELEAKQAAVRSKLADRY